MSEPRIIDRDVRLSESSLWRENRDYYLNRGVAAWSEDGLPFQVTSNPFVAESFARLAAGWMRDTQPFLPPGETFRFLELGAGTGQLGWSICRELVLQSDLPDWTYTLTDLSEKNVDALREHPRLRPLVNSGKVDCARFDAEQDHELPVGPGPVIVVATYVFDALRQDAFEIHEGQLYENRVTLHEAPAKAGLDRFSLSSTRAPFEPYDREDWNAILRQYEATLSDAIVLFPSAALEFLDRTVDSRDHVLVMACDKGYNHPLELVEAASPELADHGSLSMMVNFDAIGAWAVGQGGHRFHEDDRDVSLVCAAFAFGTPDVPATADAFHTAFGSFGPGDYYDLHAELDFDDGPLFSANTLLAMLRLGRFDPRLFFRMSDRLLLVAERADGEQRRRLRWACREVLARAYPLRGTADVAFSVGLMFYELDHHAEALAAFRLSKRWHGASKEVEHNLGLCLHALSQLTEALAAFDRAHLLDPAWSEPREGRIRVLAELELAPPLVT